MRNEVTTGHLQRFLEINHELLDGIYAFDDQSTDGTREMLEAHGAHVMSSNVRSFGRELETKNQLLSRIYSEEGQATWIFRLDADEACFATRDELEGECHVAEVASFDAISFAHLNLWKSGSMARIDDSYNSFRPLRMWKVGSGAFFPSTSGLHVTSEPMGLAKVYESAAFPIVHYGFLTEPLILDKAKTYWDFGQRGYPLHRLLLDHDKRTSSVEDLVASMGSRWESTAGNENDIQQKTSHEVLIQFNTLVEREDKPKPSVTIVCLVYKGVDWLEMQYAEILNLLSEFPAGHVDYLFVANDATDEVLAFLSENDIKHVSFKGKASADEWYINSVYRAYNFGVNESGSEYALLVNSDMSYARGFLGNMFAQWNKKDFLVARLIESGRLKSGTHGIERDLGSHPSNFRRKEFEELAKKLSAPGVAVGGLFMPLLINRETFLSLGGFPEGNLTLAGYEAYLGGQPHEYASPGQQCVPGDQAFFGLAKTKGIEHKTAMDSFAYHFQEGEMRRTRSAAGKKVRTGIWVVNDSVSGLNGEDVFWNSLVKHLKALGIRVETVEAKRPASRWEDLTMPMRLVFSLLSRRMRGPGPRLIFQNATYQFPLRAIRTVALLQDRPKLARVRWLQRLVVRFSSLVVTNDSRYFSSVVGRKSRWVPLPLSDYWYSNIAEHSNNLQENKNPTVIFVGSFTATKGWSQVEALISDSKNLNWILVSKYPLPKKLQHISSSSRIEIHSQLSPESLRSLYRRSHVLICSSPTETQHIASLEALSQGVRVVTTPVGHLGSFREGEHAWGFVAHEVTESMIRQAALKSFDPKSILQSVGIGRDHLWQLWTSLFREELQKTFELPGKASKLSTFKGRVISALLHVTRRGRRSVINRLFNLRSNIRKVLTKSGNSQLLR